VLRSGPDDLGDHVSGALHDDEVALADVLAIDVLLVVERRVRDRDAADVHRLELGELLSDHRGARVGDAIALTLAVGGLAGAFNGWFITRIGVPPLIMTLATLALFRGLAEGISQARSVRGYPDWFLALGQGEVAGVPTQLWILLAVVVISGVVLARTTFGRALYAIGHNQLAARFSGIPVDRYKLAIYTLSGLMAGLAGYIFVSRVSTTRSDMGTGLELDVIAAVVLGGTSIFGGTGSILGTVLGVILIQLLKNGLALTGVKGDATIVVIGSVLILSILITNWLRGRQET